MAKQEVIETSSDGEPLVWDEKWICPEDATSECVGPNVAEDTTHDQLENRSNCTLASETCNEKVGGECVDFDATYSCQEPSESCLSGEINQEYDCDLVDSSCSDTITTKAGETQCVEQDQTWECTKDVGVSLDQGEPVFTCGSDEEVGTFTSGEDGGCEETERCTAWEDEQVTRTETCTQSTNLSQPECRVQYPVRQCQRSKLGSTETCSENRTIEVKTRKEYKRGTLVEIDGPAYAWFGITGFNKAASTIANYIEKNGKTTITTVGDSPFGFQDYNKSWTFTLSDSNLVSPGTQYEHYAMPV